MRCILWLTIRDLCNSVDYSQQILLRKNMSCCVVRLQLGLTFDQLRCTELLYFELLAKTVTDARNETS